LRNNEFFHLFQLSNWGPVSNDEENDYSEDLDKDLEEHEALNEGDDKNKISEHEEPTVEIDYIGESEARNQKKNLRVEAFEATTGEEAGENTNEKNVAEDEMVKEVVTEEEVAGAEVTEGDTTALDEEKTSVQSQEVNTDLVQELQEGTEGYVEDSSDGDLLNVL